MPFRTRTLIYLFTGLIFQLANKNVCLAFYQIKNVNGSLDTKHPSSKISHYTTNGIFNLYGRPRPLQLRDSPYANGEITALSLLPLSQLIIDSDPYHVSSILISQVETFDGSSIVNPVVVSTIYWTNVKSKLFLLLLGQFVAGFALAVATPTILPKLADRTRVMIGDNVLKSNTQRSRDNMNWDRIIPKLFSISSSPDVHKLFQCLLNGFHWICVRANVIYKRTIGFDMGTNCIDLSLYFVLQEKYSVFIGIDRKNTALCRHIAIGNMSLGGRNLLFKR